MKLMLYGDLQTNHKNATYSQYLEKSMVYLSSLIEEHHPDLVINMGDLLDTHHVVDVEDLVWAWDWTRKIEHLCPDPGDDGYARHWIIKGNHDISDRDASIASVSVMEGPNTEICMDLQWVPLERGASMLMLPYVRDYGKLRSGLENFQHKEDIDVILGHVEWIGARYTPYRTSDIGLDPLEMQEMFPNAHIFNGHYHHPDTTGRLHMVGSPLHKDFNDVEGDMPRGFVMFDTETKQVTRFANPNTYYCLNFEFHDEQNMIDTVQELQEVKEHTRVKVSVPADLMDEAEFQFDGFLWKSITVVDSSIASIYQGQGLKVCSSAKDVVTQGVSISPDDYDSGLLLSIGEEAFGL